MSDVLLGSMPSTDAPRSARNRRHRSTLCTCDAKQPGDIIQSQTRAPN